MKNITILNFNKLIDSYYHETSIVEKKNISKKITNSIIHIDNKNSYQNKDRVKILNSYKKWLKNNIKENHKEKIIQSGGDGNLLSEIDGKLGAINLKKLNKNIESFKSNITKKDLNNVNDIDNFITEMNNQEFLKDIIENLYSIFNLQELKEMLKEKNSREGIPFYKDGWFNDAIFSKIMIGEYGISSAPNNITLGSYQNFINKRGKGIPPGGKGIPPGGKGIPPPPGGKRIPLKATLIPESESDSDSDSDSEAATGTGKEAVAGTGTGTTPVPLPSTATSPAPPLSTKENLTNVKKGNTLHYIKLNGTPGTGTSINNYKKNMKGIRLTNNKGNTKFLMAKKIVKLTKKNTTAATEIPTAAAATTAAKGTGTPLTGKNFLSALKNGKAKLTTPNKSEAAAKKTTTKTPPSEENLSSAIKGLKPPKQISKKTTNSKEPSLLNQIKDKKPNNLKKVNISNKTNSAQKQQTKNAKQVKARIEADKNKITITYASKENQKFVYVNPSYPFDEQKYVDGGEVMSGTITADNPRIVVKMNKFPRKKPSSPQVQYRMKLINKNEYERIVEEEEAKKIKDAENKKTAPVQVQVPAKEKKARAVSWVNTKKGQPLEEYEPISQPPPPPSTTASPQQPPPAATEAKVGTEEKGKEAD